MSKGQRGNKEAKKPKKAPVPKPLAPAGTPVTEIIAVPPRFKR